MSTCQLLVVPQFYQLRYERSRKLSVDLTDGHVLTATYRPAWEPETINRNNPNHQKNKSL